MSHGNHWLAIFQTEEQVFQHIPTLLQQGELVESDPGAADFGECRHIRSKDRPLCSLGIVQKSDNGFAFVTAYPVCMDVAQNELELHSFDAVDDEEDLECEQIIHMITREGTEVAFFCPAYLFFKDFLHSGTRFHIGLSAIAYELEKASSQFELTSGDLFEQEKKRRAAEDPTFDPSQFTSMTIRTDGLRFFLDQGNANFEFQSVAEEVTPFSSLSTSGYIILVNLTAESQTPLRVKIFASDKVLKGYIPRTGDPIVGIAWMQGTPQEVLHPEELWMDSIAPTRDTFLEGMMEGVDWMWSNPHLPLAVQVTGSSFIGAGWQLLHVGKDFSADNPCLIVERRDETLWIFTRTNIVGFSTPPDWKEDEIHRHQSEASVHGARCLHATVTLTPGERSFEVSIDGMAEFSEEISPPANVCRPEKFQVVNIEEPEPLPPSLDIFDAASYFASSMVSGELSSLSALMVEDFSFFDECSHKRVLGRQQFLRHLNKTLIEWKFTKKSLSFVWGKAENQGTESVGLYAFEEDAAVPFAYFVITARLGHIASIVSFDPAKIDKITYLVNLPVEGS